MLRPSYEASVLVFALGSRAWAELQQVGGEAVRVVNPGRPPSGPAGIEVGGADIVILATSHGDRVADGFVRSVAAAARSAGCLVAGACMMPASGEAAGHYPLLRSLRDGVDMLLFVHSPAMLIDFIDAVRGGAYRS